MRDARARCMHCTPVHASRTACVVSDQVASHAPGTAFELANVGERMRGVLCCAGSLSASG
jgi:hypothetical protein